MKENHAKLGVLSFIISSIKKETIATITFIIFLFWSFINSVDSMKSFIIGPIGEGKIYYFDGVVNHAYPLLAPLFYSHIPTDLITYSGPFVTVISFLLLYFLVSKKVIYYFPLLLPIPLYFQYFVPSMVDWLLVPIAYWLLKNNHEKISLLVGLVAIYFHGFIPLVYLLVIYIGTNKTNLIKWLVVLSIPQLLPLYYFSRGYITVWSKTVYTFTVFRLISFSLALLYFRVGVILLYSFVLYALIKLGG